VRKAIMLAATVAVLVLLAGTAVYAVNKTCAGLPCRGTPVRDTLYERTGNRVSDAIYGLKGSDFINAGTYERDRDQLYGGPGNDRLNAADVDGNDNLNGGAGIDTCTGDIGADYGDVGTSCERGNLADD
jgi:hypothetical protein